MVLNGKQHMKMHFVFFVYFTVIFGSLQNCKTNTVQNHCKNEFCINENYEKYNKSENPEEKLSEELHFANSTNELSEKEIYMLENFEHMLDITSNKNNFAYPMQTDEAIASFETMNNSHYSSTSYTEAPKEINNGTVNEHGVTEINSESATSTTVNPLPSETTVTKSNTPTTEMPFPMPRFFLKQNFKGRQNICLCDMKVNECDINCCCDEDCSFSHFKVFTECIDSHLLYDMKYCYRNYFIFGNNTSHEVVQKNGGLFCIAKENIKVSSNYEARATLTTLEAFNKSLPKKAYTFSYKNQAKSQFTKKDYLVGSAVWTVQNDELVPLKIPYSAVGLLCNSQVDLKYLVDQVTTCFTQVFGDECEGRKISAALHDLRITKIISSIGFLNETQNFNFSKICEAKTCIQITSYLCQSFDDSSECLKISENSTEFPHIGCSNILSNIQYNVLHNGSEGIVKVEAHLWIRKSPKLSEKLFFPLTTSVQYNWVGSARKVLKRSGNPGYLTGKPVIAGRKIFTINDTSDKKEAMEVSTNPNDWLSVLGSKKGVCSYEERIPVNFRENGQFMCSLKLNSGNFTKEKCLDLQNNIFKLLIGQDILNITRENYFNKFVATFGNSRVEDTGDWVQVLIDLFPLRASQTSFKLNHYRAICKNIITDLFIDIVYSNIGSVLTPQAKILGVSFHFGEYKDLIYHCLYPDCENISLAQDFKLSSSVRFIDVTKPPTDAFAEPLYLEAKFPHDFFYPFFSKAGRPQVFRPFVFVLSLLAFL